MARRRDRRLFTSTLGADDVETDGARSRREAFVVAGEDEVLVFDAHEERGREVDGIQRSDQRGERIRCSSLRIATCCSPLAPPGCACRSRPASTGSAGCCAPQAFDQATATGTVRMAATEHTLGAVVHEFVGRLMRRAPRLDVQIEPPGRDVFSQLAAGRLDLLVRERSSARSCRGHCARSLGWTSGITGVIPAI